MPNLPASGEPDVSILAKARAGGSQVGLGGIPELLDERVALERLLDDAALDTLAASVDEPYLAEARRVRGGDVLVHDRCDVAGIEGVKIEGAFDGDPVGHQQGYRPAS